MLRFGLTAFVALLVVVDPFGLIPIFAALTSAADPGERRAILRRAVGVALGVALFFLIAGRPVLRYLGVTVHAFAISGGILLFATALPMLFGHRAGLQAPEPHEAEAMDSDIAVFPLAIPLLSGPGTLTTILLLTARAHEKLWLLVALGLAVVVVFAVTWLVLYLGRGLIARLGEGGLAVITRVMGIVLAALAVQFVLDGATGYYHAVTGR